MDKQRLIFRGHVLDDSKLITDNKIENKNVVHLIARMEGTNSSQNNNNNSEGNRANESNIIFRRSPFSPFIAFRDLSPSRNNNERGGGGGGLFGESGFFGRSSLRIISTYSNYGRNSEYAPQPTLNSDEIRETIAQNLLEVQNMIDYGNYKEYNDSEFNEENNNMDEEEDENNINTDKKEEKNEEKNEEKKEEKKDEKKEDNINCFNLNRRILAKGQWVDVKDTVEQWLEAQVIEVSEDNKMVKIHYNHWSTRWDEWIATNSPRIMPFRYHTRQSTLTNYHSPFPNKKPDMGVTLLSFENLNRNSCVHPSNLTQQRNRTSSVISTSPINSQNNNNANNENSSTITINRSIQTNNENEINNNISINNSNSNNNNNNSNSNANDSNRNENNETTNRLNINNFISSFGRRSQGRYAEPPPPVPSPKHQEPDPENHIVKNLGGDGFLGIFREFDQINKVIGSLSSELLNEHNNNTEILTPNKLSEIQNRSYYNLKRLIPILDRTGRIYSDISTFIEHSMKTNQLELLSKNLFADVGRINEDLKYFSADERRRVSQDILSHNTRRENRSGTVNFVPPVNKFETKLINSIPIIDTPYMTGRNDTQISPILDIFIQNNNNNIEEETGSMAEENNNNNNNGRNSENNNLNENRNNSFVRNINVDSFHIEFKAEENNNNDKNDDDEEKSIKNGNKIKKNKNGLKMLGVKTRRNKSKKKNGEKNQSNSKDEDKKTKKKN